jgi:AraC family transcriptional regulator
MEVDAVSLPRGGLAPRQVRDVRIFIETNLESPLTTKDLASAANLSTFHFCRAFRVSFNMTPHAYVMRRRIERAQGLMLQTDTSLGQIAMDCGLADQAHFNRLFRRLVGDSPGAWRRARKMAPALRAPAHHATEASPMCTDQIQPAPSPIPG